MSDTKLSDIQLSRAGIFTLYSADVESFNRLLNDFPAILVANGQATVKLHHHSVPDRGMARLYWLYYSFDLCEKSLSLLIYRLRANLSIDRNLFIFIKQFEQYNDVWTNPCWTTSINGYIFTAVFLHTKHVWCSYCLFVNSVVMISCLFFSIKHKYTIVVKNVMSLSNFSFY